MTTTVLDALGAALIVAGIALVSVAAALVVAGVMVLAASRKATLTAAARRATR